MLKDYTTYTTTPRQLTILMYYPVPQSDDMTTVEPECDVSHLHLY